MAFVETKTPSNVKNLTYLAIILFGASFFLPVLIFHIGDLSYYDSYYSAQVFEYSISDIGSHVDFESAGLDNNTPYMALIAAIVLTGIAAFQTSQQTYSLRNSTPFYLLFAAAGAAGFAAWELKQVFDDIDAFTGGPLSEAGSGAYTLIAGAIVAGIAGYLGIQAAGRLSRMSGDQITR